MRSVEHGPGKGHGRGHIKDQGRKSRGDRTAVGGGGRSGAKGKVIIRCVTTRHAGKEGLDVEYTGRKRGIGTPGPGGNGSPGRLTGV